MTHQRTLRRLVSAGFPFLLLPWAPATAVAAGQQEHIAIEDARVIVGDGTVLEGVDLLITDGMIEAIGPDLALPPNAEHILATGLTVSAGWIDAFNTGLFVAPEPPAQPVPGNAGEEPDFSQEAMSGTREANRAGVAPERHARDFLRLSEAEVSPLRQTGFTAVLVAPPGGLLRGMGCLVDLSARRPRTATVAVPDLLFAHLRERLDGGYPSTLMGNLAHVRQTLLDAQQLRAWEELYQQQPRGTPRPPSDTSLEALQPVLAGAERVAFVADSELDIRRALHLAEEFALRPVLVGGAEAYRVSGLLAEAHVPVIARMSFGDEPERLGLKKKSAEEREAGPPGRRRRRPPQDSLTAGAAEEEEGTSAKSEGKSSPDKAPDPVNLEPEKLFEQRKATWRDQVNNVRTLLDAGVTVALTTDGCKDTKEFLKNLRKAVELGLGEDAALRALTGTPAEILGVSGFLGRVEPGMLGNLMLVKGSLGDAQRSVPWVVVGGRRFEGPKEEKKDEGKNAAEALAGTWVLTGESQGDESFHATLVLHVEGGEWSGSVTHALGEFPVSRSKIEGKDFEVAIQVKFEREAVEFVLRGTLGDEGLKGSMETPFGTQSFTGVRAEEPKETTR